MKTIYAASAFLAACALCSCTTKEVEKTVVQREPAKVIVEHRQPETVTRERIIESQTTDAFGQPIEQRRRVTTEYTR